MSTRTNLSALALKYSTLNVFFMIALVAAGTYDFFSLGRAEDPPFTIKQMVVSATTTSASTARSSTRAAQPSRQRHRPSRRSPHRRSACGDCSRSAACSPCWARDGHANSFA